MIGSAVSLERLAPLLNCITSALAARSRRFSADAVTPHLQT